MSLKQRRDHKPVWYIDIGDNVCIECGDPVEYVEVVGHDETKPVAERRTVRGYWRHTRRWQRRP